LRLSSRINDITAFEGVQGQTDAQSNRRVV
jgi:hypothetical protein